MRRLLLSTLAVTALLMIGNSAGADSWSSPDDFTVHFWKEMFKGGGPGQPGNTLMANGEGFIFKQATLESVMPSSNPDYDYETTYVDGSMVLNSQGPWRSWIDRGTLRASNITATNFSSLDPTTGVLRFELHFEGEFDSQPGTYFEVTATYEGIPEYGLDPYGNPEFHRGFAPEFAVTIEITTGE